MTIRKKIKLLFLLIGTVVFISLLITVHNFREFKINRELQEIFHQSIHDLDNTSLLLVEMLVSPNQRVRMQLRMQEDSFRTSQSFARLSEYRDFFPLVHPLVEKRKDFLTLLDNFLLLLDNEDHDPEALEQTTSLLFVFSHEMQSIMSLLHTQIQNRIAHHTLIFVFSALGSLLLLTFLLFVTLIWIRQGFLLRILRMDQLARRIAHGEYCAALPVESNDELAGLARSFNVMSDAVQEQVEHLATDRDKFSTILASIGDAVVAVDNENRIMIMNPVAERMTGWKSSEAVGHYIHEVVRLCTPGTREPFKNPLPQVLAAGESAGFSEHMILISRSGTEYLVQDSASPVQSHLGKTDGAVLVFRDITDQAQMQEIVAQNEKMLSVGGLAAGVAQEIKTPLSDLASNIELLEAGLNDTTEENRSVAEKVGATIESISAYLHESGAMNRLATIREESTWVLRILEKMLVFAEVKAGNKEAVDISVPLDNAVELSRSDYELKSLIDFRKIIIVRDYEKHLPPVICDPVGIQQVFLNIIRNALQAMHADKTDPPRLYLRLAHAEDSHSVCIEIADNGPGMEEHVRKRVFDPFFTTRAKGEGSGLGLSIVYFIVTDTHGGSIEVRSSPGSGTRFIIYLPFEAAAQ